MHTLDQSEGDRRFLAATAVLLHFLSSTGFMVEAVQLWLRRWNYFKDLDNYFQLALYTLIIIFILAFNNECWCSTHWQWQIGAFAVFLLLDQLHFHPQVHSLHCCPNQHLS